MGLRESRRQGMGRQAGMETKAMYSNTRTTMQTAGRPPHNNNKHQRMEGGRKAWLQRIGTAHEPDEWFLKRDGGQGMSGGWTARVRKRRRRQRLGEDEKSRGGCRCGGEWQVEDEDVNPWLLSPGRSPEPRMSKPAGEPECGPPPTPSNNNSCAPRNSRQNSIAEVAKLARVASINHVPAPPMTLSQRPIRRTPGPCERDLPCLSSHGARRGHRQLSGMVMPITT